MAMIPAVVVGRNPRAKTTIMLWKIRSATKSSSLPQMVSMANDVTSARGIPGIQRTQTAPAFSSPGSHLPRPFVPKGHHEIALSRGTGAQAVESMGCSRNPQPAH